MKDTIRNLKANEAAIKSAGYDVEQIWATKDITKLPAAIYSAAWAYIEQRAATEGIPMDAIRAQLKHRPVAAYVRRDGKYKTSAHEEAQIMQDCSDREDEAN